MTDGTDFPIPASPLSLTTLSGRGQDDPSTQGTGGPSAPSKPRISPPSASVAILPVITPALSR